MTFVQGTGNIPSPGSTTAATIAQAYGSNNTAGNDLLAFVTWGLHGATINGITDTRSNTWTQLGATIQDTTNNQQAALFIAYNVAAGANTVTATFSATTTFRGLIVEEYSAVGYSSVQFAGQFATNTTATGNATSTAVTTVLNSRQIAAFVVNTSSLGTISTGTGFTSRVNLTAVVPMRSEDLVQGSAGSIAGTFTIGTAGQYIAFVVAFAPPYTSSLSGGLSFVGAQSKRTARSLTAAMSFVGAVARRTARSLTAGFTPAGALSSVWATSIQFDAASSSGYEAALSSYSWNHTCTGPNRGLLVNISIFATGTVTALTYNSVGMRFVRADTIGVYRNEVWALENPASGTHAIAVTLNTSLTSIGSASSYTGVNQTDMVETSGAATGSGVSTPSVAILPVDDKSWVWSGLTTSDPTQSVSGGATQRANNTGALGTGAISDIGPISPSSSTTMSWAAVTITDSWALTAVVLDPLVGSVYAQALSAALSFVGTTTKWTARSLTAGFTPAGTVARRTGRSLSAALSFTGAVSKRTTRGLTAAALSFSGAVSRRTSRAFSASLSFTGGVSRRIGRALSAALSFVGSLSSIHSGGGTTYTQSLSASLSFVGAQIKSTTRPLSAALSFVGAVNRRTSRLLPAALSFVGSLNRGTGRALSASLTSSGALARRTARRLPAASLAFTGALSKRTSRGLTAAVSFVGVIGRRAGKGLAASFAPAGNLNRSTRRAFTAALTTTGTIARSIRRNFTAATGLIGNLASNLIHGITGGTVTSVTPTGPSVSAGQTVGPTVSSVATSGPSVSSVQPSGPSVTTTQPGQATVTST